MRVIAGEARGRQLAGPPSLRTRPTTDMVKGALFSMIETLLVLERPGDPTCGATVDLGDPGVWAGLNVLDLYAGTGALGIEALSRGAAWCDFVETDARVRGVIDRNVKATGVENRSRTFGLDVAKVVGTSGANGLRAPYGVVFMDPPYADSTFAQVLDALATGQLLDTGSLVALEHSRRVAVATRIPGARDERRANELIEVRRRRHGNTEISIYRWQDATKLGEGDDGNHRDLSG